MAYHRGNVSAEPIASLAGEGHFGRLSVKWRHLLISLVARWQPEEPLRSQSERVDSYFITSATFDSIERL